MVEVWRAGDLEKRLEFQKVLSRSSTSAVLLYTDLVRKCDVVVKSYSSQWMRGTNLRVTQLKENTRVLSGPSYPESTRFYFKKEAALLENLADSKIVPPIYAVVPEHLSIVMGYIEGVAFSKKFMEIDLQQVEENLPLRAKEVKKNALRERLLDHLVEFYNYTEKLSEDTRNGLLQNVKKGNKVEHLSRYSVPSFPYIRLRSQEEENTRLRHYLLKLVYGGSEEFKNNNSQFYGTANIARHSQQRKRLWNLAKREVKSYLASKNIDFNQFSKRFQELYFSIVFDDMRKVGSQELSVFEKLNQRKLRVIHGDFGPHNILSAPGKFGTILDFNELRIAHPHVDVSLALFNLYSNPTESRVPRLIEYFWERQQGVKEAYPSFPDFLAGCVATRVFQSLRIASRNVEYESADIERFVEGHPMFKDLTVKERDVRFKYDRIIELGETIPFYMIGDGNGLLASAQNSRREKLSEFLEMVRNLISVTYIMPPLEKYRGKRDLGVES